MIASSIRLSNRKSGFNALGEVIGIVVSSWRDSQNLNFAIPINELHNVQKLTVALSLQTFTDHQVALARKRAKEAYDAGLKALQAQDHDLAISYFEEASIFWPTWAHPFLFLGHLYLHRGWLDDAEYALTAALRLDPRLSAAYTALGAVYDRKGLLDLALRNLKQAVALNPSDDVAYLRLAMVLRERGAYDEAIANALRAARIKRSQEVYLVLGDLWFSKGEYENSFDAFSTANAFGPLGRSYSYVRALAQTYSIWIDKDETRFSERVYAALRTWEAFLRGPDDDYSKNAKRIYEWLKTRAGKPVPEERNKFVSPLLRFEIARPSPEWVIRDWDDPKIRAQPWKSPMAIGSRFSLSTGIAYQVRWRGMSRKR